MENTITSEQINKIFASFERSLNKYYKCLKELREYQDSELSKAGEYISYGRCKGIYQTLCMLGLDEEFTTWARSKNLNYYEVLNFVMPEEYRHKKQNGAYFE